MLGRMFLASFIAVLCPGARPLADGTRLFSFTSRAKTFMGTALVARGDRVLLSKGYGSANLEWNIPNAPDTQVPAGLHHQAVHGSLRSAAGRTRQLENGRSREEVYSPTRRRPGIRSPFSIC